MNPKLGLGALEAIDETVDHGLVPLGRTDPPFGGLGGTLHRLARPTPGDADKGSSRPSWPAFLTAGRLLAAGSRMFASHCALLPRTIMGYDYGKALFRRR